MTPCSDSKRLNRKLGLPHAALRSPITSVPLRLCVRSFLFACLREFPLARSSLREVSRDANLRLHAVRWHLHCEIECVHAILKIKSPANEWLHIDLSRTHQSQRARINMRVTEDGFDGCFLGLQSNQINRHR